MNWQPYPHYRDSGVEWMGPIPNGWEVVRTRFLCDIQTGDKDTVNSNVDGEFPFFVRSQKVERINTWSFDCTAVLTAGDGAGVGKIYHYFEGKFDAHQRVYIFNNFRRVTGRYFYFYFSNLFARVALDGGAKSTVDSLRRPVIAGFPVAVPDLATQEQIVKFLEVESDRVDALIGKQEHLIAALREGRTATITHAVTKGLNPDVEMKDSGVRWLTEIPSHWEVVQSRRIFTQRKGRALPGDTQLTASQKYGVIPQREFTEREGSQVTQVILNPEILKHVEAGDFVISMRSFQGGIEYSGHSGAVSSAYVPLVPSRHVCAEFFKYALKSTAYIQALQSTSNLVRDGQALRFENFAMVPLPSFPLSEQIQIADYLNNQCSRIDALIDKATAMIQALREYRSALITDAVTGKIDVRGEV